MCIASRGNDGEVTNQDWHPVGVIEYGYVAPDPLDTDVIYGAGRKCRFKVSLVNRPGAECHAHPRARCIGSRGPDGAPAVCASGSAYALLCGQQGYMRRTMEGQPGKRSATDLTREQPGIPASVGAMHAPEAQSQRGVIYSLAASARNANLLWAGTDDGLVWKTEDGGKHWSDVTPDGLSAWSKVTQIDASHHGREHGCTFPSVECGSMICIRTFSELTTAAKPGNPSAAGCRRMRR